MVASASPTKSVGRGKIAGYLRDGLDSQILPTYGEEVEGNVGKCVGYSWTCGLCSSESKDVGIFCRGRQLSFQVHQPRLYLSCHVTLSYLFGNNKFSYLLTIMSNHHIRVFNAFDMQTSASIADHAEIQEAIDYCESRFRVILIAFSQADEQQRPHIQSGLLQELVSNPLE